MEKLLFGLGVTVLGLAVTFAGLIILIGFIKLLGVFSKERKKPAAEASKAEVAPVETPASVKEEEDETIPAEVIAAITAAIASVWDGENGFTVRHIKRVHNAPAWNRAGREEQSYNRI